MSKHTSISRRESRNAMRKAPAGSLPLRKTWPLSLCVGLALGSIVVSGDALAGGPTGGKVVGGAGSIIQSGNQTTINQISNRLALNWSTFNVGANESVLFNQPGRSAVALNRILDQSPSQIFGKINSNGQVFLINTHGIIFGATAQLNVGGLMASTLDLTPKDFLAGNYNLNAVGAGAGVVNHGTIQAASGGSVSLVGGSVLNDGLILANYGNINLDGAEHATLDFDGDGLINIQITGELKKRLDEKQAAVSNTGSLKADDGTVVLQASAAKDLFTNLVNNSGVIDASGISTDGGVVRLVGTGGNVENSGNINASGTRGGRIELLADKDVLVTGGTLDASGTTSGGAIRAGGGVQGGEGLVIADRTYVADGSLLNTDAIGNGQGGSIAVYSQNNTVVAGALQARGGTLGGNGGFIETSSHGSLDIVSTPQVNARAMTALGGEWLIDPNNITIVAGSGNTRINNADPFVSTNDNASLGVDLITNALTGGANVTITTGTGGTNAQAGDITLATNLDFNGTGSNTLKFDAAHDIIISNQIYDSTAGGDALNLNLTAGNNISLGANVSLGAGTATLLAGGNIDQASGAITAGTLTGSSTGATVLSGANHIGTLSTFGAASFALVNAQALTVSGPVTTTGGTGDISLTTTGNAALALDTDLSGGAISLNSGGALNLTHDVTAASLQLASGAGIVQSGGTLLVSGTTGISSGDAIVLNSGGNNFGGAVGLTGDTAQITSVGDLTLGTLNTGGLAVTSGGALDLGTGTVNGNLSASSTTSITLNGAISGLGDAMFSGSAPTGSGSMNGTGSISGIGSNTFTLTGTKAGTSGGIGFSGFAAADAQQIAGATGFDDASKSTNGMTFAAATSVVGSGTVSNVNASFADNTGKSSATNIVYSGFGSVSGSGGSLTGVTGDFNVGSKVSTASGINYSGFNLGTVAGSGSNATITGSGQVYALDNALANTGSSNGVNWSSFANLSDGTGTVNFGTGGGVSGNITAKTLNYAAFSTPVTFNLSHVSGATTGIGGIWTGVTTVNGSIGSDTITGSGETYALTGINAGNNGTVQWTSIENLNDSGAGTVNFGSGSSVSGDIKAHALNYGSYGTPVTFDLADGSGTTTGIGGTWSGVLTVAGSSGSDTVTGISQNWTLTGINAGSNGLVSWTSFENLHDGGIGTLIAANQTWNLTGHNQGSMTDLTGSFTGMGNLTDSGAGRFIMHSGADGDISGNLDGGTAGSLDYTGYGTAVDVNLSGAGTTGVGGNTSGISAITANTNLGVSGTATGSLGITTTGAGTTATLGGLSVGSNLTMTASGAVLQGGALSVVGTSTINAGTNAITLNNASNDFGGAVNLTGGTTSITDQNALTLGTVSTGALNATSTGPLNLGHGAIAGNLVVTSNGGTITQASGGLQVTGTSNLQAGAGAITLTDAANHFTGAVTAAGQGVTLRDSGDLTIASLSSGTNGTVSLTAGGMLGTPASGIDTGTADLTLIANGGALTTPGALSGAHITLRARDALTLGNNVTSGGTVSLTSTNGAISQSGGVLAAATLTGSSAGDTTLNGANAIVTLGSFSADNFALNNAQALTVTGPVVVTGSSGLIQSAGPLTLSGDLTGGSSTGDQLSLASTSTIAQTGGVITANTLGLSSNGGISLTDANKINNLGLVTNVGGGGVDLHNAQSLNLSGDINVGTAVGNDLNLVVTGTMTQSAASVVTANSLTGSATGSVSLGGDNLITSLGAFNAANFALTNAQALSVDGTLTVPGSVSLTTSSGGLSLNTDLTAGAIALDSAAALTLAHNLNASSLSLTAGGAISQTGGSLVVSGTTLVDAGANGITLIDAGNDFGGTVNLTGGTTQIADSNGLTLGTLNTGALTATSNGLLNLGSGSVVGALDASANGTITQAAALTVTGPANITQNSTSAGASQDINLGAYANAFQAGVTFAAGPGAQINNLSLQNTASGGVTLPANIAGNLMLNYTSGGLILPVVGVGGSLDVTAAGGITVNGDVTTGGAQHYRSNVLLGNDVILATTNSAVTFDGNVDNASATAHALTLDAGSAAVSIAGLVGAGTNGAVLSLIDTSGSFSANTLNIGSGGLSLTTSAGDITQSGKFVVVGASNFNAVGGAVVLTNADNDFQGAVSATGAGVSLTDVNNLTVSTLTDNANGDVSLIAGGQLSFPASSIDTGTGNLTLTANGGSLITGGALSGNNVSLSGSSGVTLGGDVTANGTLNLASANAAITQSAGAITVGGNAIMNAGSGAITLNGSNNDFVGTASLTGGSTQISDKNALTLGTVNTGALTASSTGALNLGTATVAGNLSATSHNGAISQNGALNVSGSSAINAGTGAITLTNTGNDFVGATSLTGGSTQITDKNALTLGSLSTGALTAVSTGALNLGQGSVVGNLSATSNNGTISQNGALNVSGSSAINAGTGAIALTDAGNDFVGATNLTGGSTQITDKNTLTLGTVNTGALTASSTGALNLGTATVAGNLSATSHNGAISQNGALNVSGSSAINAGTGAITLTNTGNDFVGATNLTGGSTQITDKNALTLGSLSTGALTAVSTGALNLGQGSVVGNLSATSNNGTISQNGALNVSGSSAINAGTGAIALTDAGNDFVGATNLTGGSTQITDKNTLTLGTVNTGALTASSTGALNLGTATVAGNLSATSHNGAISQNGALNVSGSSAINAGTGAITLTNTGNDFVGAANLTGGSTQITDKNVLTLGSLSTGALTAVSTGVLNLGQGSVDGNLSATSNNGVISQSGALAVSGSSAINAGTGAITLTNAGNDFVGAASLTGGTTQISDKNALTLGTVNTGALTASSTGALNLGTATVAGNLSATSHNGAISQNGALNVSGSSTINAGTGAITLTNTGNDFVGATSLTGGSTQITDKNALTLGSLSTGALTAVSTGVLNLGQGSVGSNLSATSHNGAISQNGALNVSGSSAINAGTGAIALTDANNDFVGAASLTGGTTQISDKNALTLGTVNTGALTASSTGALNLGTATVAGNLSATSHNGAISQNGALNVSGSSTINAGTGAITLTNTGNDFVGAASLTGGSTQITDKNVLTLGAVDAGALTVAAGGNLVLGGPVKGGATSLQSGGTISQGTSGILTASSLSGQSTGATTLDQANKIGSLGDFSANNFAVTNAQTLTVSGAVNGGNRTVLITTAGDMAINGTVVGTNMVLRSAGNLSEGASGAVKAHILIGKVVGDTTLEGNNLVDILGNFDADFSFTNAETLTISDPLVAGRLLKLTTTSGDLIINAAISGSSTTLNSAGAITQGAGGSITADTLTGHSAGATTLNGANHIGSLGDFTASSFALTNAQAMTVSGAVNGGSSTALTTTSGDLGINAALSGTATTLTSAGAISEGAGGVITAHGLSGSATGVTSLGSDTQRNNNKVDLLGNFSSQSGFSMTNDKTITLASLNGSAFTVDAGTSTFYLSVTNGDLLQQGKTWLYDGTGTWGSTGRMGTAAAPIYVTGVGLQTVANVGLPPAYFYAVDSTGNLLPLGGGFAVNIPTAEGAGGAQNGNHGDSYIDPGVITANYRSYGIVPSGLRLPQDQQAGCDPDQPDQTDCQDGDAVGMLGLGMEMGVSPKLYVNP